MFNRILGIGNGAIEPPNLHPVEVAQRELLDKKIDLDDSLAALVQKYPLSRDNIFLTNHPDDDIGMPEAKSIPPKPKDNEIVPPTNPPEFDDFIAHNLDKNGTENYHSTVIDDPYAKLENPWKKFVFSNEAVDSVVKLINAHFSEGQSKDDFQEAIHSQVNEVIKNAGQSVGRYPKLESDIAAVLVNLAAHKMKSNGAASVPSKEMPTQEITVPEMETDDEARQAMWLRYKDKLGSDPDSYAKIMQQLQPGIEVVANELLDGRLFVDENGKLDVAAYNIFAENLILALAGDIAAQDWIISSSDDLNNFANKFLQEAGFNKSDFESQPEKALPETNLLLLEAWDLAEMVKTQEMQQDSPGYRDVINRLQNLSNASAIPWSLLYEEVRKMFFIDLPNYRTPIELAHDLDQVLNILDTNQEIQPDDAWAMHKLKTSHDLYRIFAPLFSLASRQNESKPGPQQVSRYGILSERLTMQRKNRREAVRAAQN